MKILDKQRFQNDLLNWYDQEKRDLPWRKERDPYRIWVSEIMLQQTKVDTVIPYFYNFMDKFPTLEKLAEAEEEEVLKAWEGLGYYSRARNLHTAVKEVKEFYNGQVPDTEDEIKKLRGVGPYTAGAILSIAYNVPAPAVDGNVMRVLSRIFTIYDDISKVSVRKKFEEIVRETIAADRASDFNQAMMELGATVCTPRSPACLLCPVQQHCEAREEGVQEILPVKAKKKAPRPVSLKALVAQDYSGRYLVEKRPDTGLLAKLWQFPYIESLTESDEDLKSFAEELSVNAEKFSYQQHVRHVFSHLVWEMDVYQARGKITNPAPNQKLLTKEELKELTFPVSHQKILYKLEEEL
ncbi:A/G-specific adenine glycosylase [Alkalicoccus halolimnae]|uniref:Adenine DNA glycosylase n=1 Tax=Alkalicoccus halolimnae TaxID=1667239 RepID=A0A5C7F6Z5_9BACI|nr:A/G-specific adenine glycosylase [Alkalicoccus halolimnae]TXF85178.1 A/G-specific adenine glycosylase [Alkalicoccus halolimnae]